MESDVINHSFVATRLSLTRHVQIFNMRCPRICDLGAEPFHKKALRQTIMAAW